MVGKFIDFFQGETINKKSLHIEWFGGEPTLYLDKIIDFNYRLKSICANNECDFSSSMVSNGYLITNEVLDRLYAAGITSYLITIDGLKETHNKRRFLKNGKGSFDDIVTNITYIGSRANLKIRINVDFENRGEILSLIKYLKDKIKDKNNIEIIIAPVYNFSDNNLKDYIEIITQVYYQIKEYGFKFDIINYLFKKGSCMAPYKSHYLIDIYGDVYKCNSLAGKKDYRDGYMDYSKMEIRYNDRILDFMTFNPFYSFKCKECIYIPVCKGGCVITQDKVINKLNNRSACVVKNDTCKKNYTKLVDNIFDSLKQELD